jgi:hypothetical protein
MLETLIRLPILLLALILNPLLVASGGRRRCGYAQMATRALLMLLGSHTLIPVALHLGNIPLTSLSLAAGHLALLPLCAGWGASRFWRTAPSVHRLPPRRLMLAATPAVLFLLLTAPVTNFTGIDTYKWQDLASTITIDQSITWLVHPLSWFGFTPHAYPSIFPVYLGSLELLGQLSIKGGFWIASSTLALLGYVGFFRLSRRLHPAAAVRTSIITASLYIFAPVFVRYAHWGTGRGLLLALFPFLLTALLAISPRRPLTWLAPCGWSLLLLGAHKAAWIAIPCAVTASLAAAVLPRSLTRCQLRIGGLALAAIGGIAVLAHPQLRTFTLPLVAGAPRYAFSRYAWMLPASACFALLPLWSPTAWASPLSRNADRWLFCLLLGTLPLAFESHMYGALIALPAIVLSASSAMQACTRRYPSRASALLALVGCLTLGGATAVVVHRSRLATPGPVKAAALFLQLHDPAGPFIIEAPGRARTQMQAYLTGCPRFAVEMQHADGARAASWQKLRSARSLEELIGLLRGGLAVTGVESSWYGEVKRHYVVTLDTPPSMLNSEPIYAAGGVRVYVKERSP